MKKDENDGREMEKYREIEDIVFQLKTILFELGYWEEEIKNIRRRVKELSASYYSLLDKLVKNYGIFLFQGRE